MLGFKSRQGNFRIPALKSFSMLYGEGELNVPLASPYLGGQCIGWAQGCQWFQQLARAGADNAMREEVYKGRCGESMDSEEAGVED